MKSIIIREPGRVEVSEVRDLPERKDGEALLKLLYGGICGSDLGTFRGSFAYTVYPCIPGHEFAAEIVDIDDDNGYGLKRGQIVTCNPYFNCGKCKSCRNGIVNACMDNKTMGVQREGAFSEYVSMPLERIYDGKGLSARQLTLIEPFCIAHHGVKRGEVKSGDDVLIVGAGTIGVFAALSARAKGANVTLCDVSQEKLDYARNTFFFDSVILNNNSENFTDKVAEKTKGEGFDVAIEAVGLNSTFKNCIDAVCFGGRVVLIGIPKKPLDDFALNLIQKKELCVRGSRNALKEDFIELIDLVKSGAVDIEKVVTNEYSWLEADKAFSDFSANAGKMLKVLLRFE